MNWINLQTEEQLTSLKEQSFNNPLIIFKHSTRCSISSVAKNRLEKAIPPQDTSFYLLDLLQFRGLSNKIASEFDVWHESPQILVIKDGKCIYDESHGAITMDDIRVQLN
jgi:bacillithiol system protein YtxJ